MEWARSVGDNSLVTSSKCFCQYWEGYYDALRKCARILRRGASVGLTKEQLTRLAAAFEVQAQQTAIRKLSD